MLLFLKASVAACGELTVSAKSQPLSGLSVALKHLALAPRFRLGLESRGLEVSEKRPLVACGTQCESHGSLRALAV